MTKMTPDKRKQITRAVRQVLKELEGELTNTEALNEINSFAASESERISNASVISKKTQEHSTANFDPKSARLCERWLKAKHPWALAKSMNEKQIRSIQEYFGVYYEQIQACRKSIVGDYICYRYDDDEPRVVSNVEQNLENPKVIISKLSIEYLGQQGILRVNETLKKRMPYDTEDFVCEWDGLCFPEGEFFRLVLRDYSQDEHIPHSKTILVKPDQHVSGLPIRDLYGRYLLSMGSKGFMRTRRIYLFRGKRIPKYKSNPVPISELNPKILSKLRSFDKKFAALD